MRIIAGVLRSRVLRSPKGDGCRPAMGRTREALYSMLEARGLSYEETRILDIFAGSGSLAFEGISRGALNAVLVENARSVVSCIEANRKALGLEEQVHIVQEDAVRFLRTAAHDPFQLVFLDPPYRKNLVTPCLELLCTFLWLAPQALVVAEVEDGYTPIFPDRLVCCTDRLFGQTRVFIARYTSEDETI